MASGLRSPNAPRSNAPSPRPQFDSDLLKAYIKKLLTLTLQSATWPDTKDRDRVKGWIKEIGERVKERMLEIQPKGLCVLIALDWQGNSLIVSVNTSFSLS
jgi:hypothetical protein